MHRLPVGHNFAGARLAVGTALIFLLASLRYALVAALAARFAIAAVLDFAHSKPIESEALP